ncbi:hypothetical protein B0H16DRAFT_1588823 [Mycena metata]|uniref:Uncharacterized protein n=1 Tax=Mycena metata TaxID=1033252 RepID=A0AAD7MS82_9AGAR|nr:hypothetical protein B0H16DRAFT_1588823 [Mycena metata]
MHAPRPHRLPLVSQPCAIGCTHRALATRTHRHTSHSVSSTLVLPSELPAAREMRRRNGMRGEWSVTSSPPLAPRPRHASPTHSPNTRRALSSSSIHRGCTCCPSGGLDVHPLKTWHSRLRTAWSAPLFHPPRPIPDPHRPHTRHKKSAP